MSGSPKSRLSLVFGTELRQQATRPLIWFLIVLLGLTSWGLSQGNVRIASGDSSVGGTKAWITSEFSNAKLSSVVIFCFYSLFLAVAAGMVVIQDDERKIGEILHATPLRPGEYVWGKFLAVMAAFGGVLVLHLAFAIFFNHLLPNPKAVEIRGPLHLLAYLRPALLFGIPTLVLMGGATFAIGERTRKPILVFFLPVALVLVSVFFLWNWSPSWLSPQANRILMLLDPAGVRWLTETWLKVDRGVEFYNHAPVGVDAPFVLSRLVFVLLGLASVAASGRHFATSLRGAKAARRVAVDGSGGVAADASEGRARGVWARARGRREPARETSGATRERELEAEDQAAGGLPAPAPLPVLIPAQSSPPGLLRGILQVLRFELKELRGQPGLYLFIPMILLQTLGTCLVAYGPFDTPVLATPGTIAVRAMNTLTLLICFLTLFYTVESLRRERNTGLFAIYYATPARTASFLFGKALANCFIGLLVAFGTFLGGAIALLAQGRMAVDPGPFVIVWGLALVPTFLVWTSFVILLFALTNDRYVTYGLGLAALGATGLLQVLGKMTWVGNWILWDALRWSDLGIFPLDRSALLLNRLSALGLAVFFVALAVRVFPRRDRDAIRTAHRLAPGSFLRSAARMAPYAVVPAALLVALWIQVNQGFQGKAAEKKEKDYWKQNLATWKDAPLPDLTHVDLDLVLEPSGRFFRMNGSYDLMNRTDQPLVRVPLTGGIHWKKVRWTMNGDSAAPEDRSRLYVFTPARPLATGDSVRIGFSYEGRYPEGITKNGGGTMEFIVPAGVVLTSFTPSVVPLLGYNDEIGVTKDNKYEPKVYADDFYLGKTEPMIGTASPFTTRIRITGPAGYELNSVGIKTADEVRDGRRTVVWESDHPVRFFNVVAGKLERKEGKDTELFYSRKHMYNVEAMSACLDAARKYYSEWFLPYPWRELKVTEFPALAYYAQGFPTNITFSEGIGFLTKDDPRGNAAFVVTAHETAHQWWGNILTPGKGPGGDIVAEGMAHFSTVLLLDEVKGRNARIEFCKAIEAKYGDDRQMDSERPLVKIDGSKTGDETVTYNKGGFVFWMLLNHMGRDRCLEGLREFIREYKDGPDYPVLQDFVRVMRPFAPDSTAFDAFVQQWFFQVVVPEYKLSGARREEHDRWTAVVRVRNAGTGLMPLDVAACAGERFDKKGAPDENYRESRITVEIPAGEEKEVTIPCSFKPERILADPDALVLQLRRKDAVASF